MKKCVDRIRTQYRDDWKSKEMRIRQRAVALYFIDKVKKCSKTVMIKHNKNKFIPNTIISLILISDAYIKKSTEWRRKSSPRVKFPSVLLSQ